MTRPLRAIVLGAGMAGIVSGIKLRELQVGEIAIYEKGDGVGGTWRENTYPGLTCDVPSHHYTYSFERNPDWTRHLPPGEEVLAYFKKVAHKYRVLPMIRFGEEAVSARYRDGRWEVVFRSGHIDHADILIAATGVLHHPKIPQIEGMDRFSGALFHSARWDHRIPLEGKRIGVVGSGSTGVQVVSALAGRAALVEHYQRTAQWIMPVENGHFSARQRAAFRDPAVLEAAMDFDSYNAAVNAYTQAIVDETSGGARQIAEACLQNLEQGVSDPLLREKLRPDHRPLCKRLIFSPDYYQAIQHPDARLVTDPIARLESAGIRTADGELHPLDVIVLATGFHADAFMRPMRLTGRNGTDLETLWADHPQAYLAISLPDFPNFFMLNGPNGPVGNFSLIDIAEHQWNYISQLIQRLQCGDVEAICCTARAMAQYEAAREAAAKKTVWYTGGCNSWYLDARGIPASWPWTFSRFVEMMAEPQWSDFDIVERTV